MLAGEMKESDAYVLGNNTKCTVNSKDLKKVLVVAYGYGGSYTAVVVEK